MTYEVWDGDVFVCFCYAAEIGYYYEQGYTIKEAAR